MFQLNNRKTRWARGLFAIAFLLLVSADPAVAQPRNILFLFADDQREDTIGAYGNPHIITPSLDRLAGMGTGFRQNYCFGANSGAVCVPSRAMVHSGRPWTRISTSLEGTPMLSGILGKNGYQTFISGKWHNGRDSVLRGFQQGKAVMMGGMSNHAEVPLVDISGDGKELVNQRTGDRMSSELFASATVDFLRNRDRSRPFFAYCAFTAPHDPRQPPQEFRDMYYRNRPPLPANYLPQHPFDNGHMNGGRDENLGPWPRTPDLIREQLAEYYGLISFMDQQIGRVFTELDAQDLWKDTLVIYAADHGLAIGSHGLLGKQSIYEHSMKCPLILAGPGVPAGQQRHAFTYLLDIFPTVLEFAGLEAPQPVEGQSLWPLVDNASASVRDSIFLPFLKLMRSCRDERYKIIYYPPINHVQLFDLRDDPDEMINLAPHPEYAPIVDRLTTRLRQWQESVGDDLPLRVDNPKPMQIDLTGKPRSPDRWQPEWIIKKYFNAYQL